MAKGRVRVSYSENFKEMIVKKAMSPESPGLMEIAEENNVHHTTVKRWIDLYGNNSFMTKINKKHLSPEQKLQLLMESFSLSGNELGEFLRTNGLHSSDLAQWKEEFLSGAKRPGPGRPKKDPEVSELKQKEKALTKELKRKDKALAEMAARIVLLKKSHLIWGDEEDDE